MAKFRKPFLKKSLAAWYVQLEGKQVRLAETEAEAFERYHERMPIPASKGHPKRVDYEYERKGTASTFLFAEPLPGFRQATARPRRTKDDWAREVAHLLDTRCAGVERITLVCDNPNTHTEGAFYEAFPTDRRIGDLATLRSEIAAWSARVNDKQRAVGWRFTIDEARVKLKRLYPKR